MYQSKILLFFFTWILIVARKGKITISYPWKQGISKIY